MKNNNKPFSFDELSELIVTAIEQENFFDKRVLIPKVRAIIRAFQIKISITNYSKEGDISDRGRYIRTIEEKDIMMQFWKNKVKILDKENMAKHFSELDQKLTNLGFINNAIQ